MLMVLYMLGIHVPFEVWIRVNMRKSVCLDGLTSLLSEFLDFLNF